MKTQSVSIKNVGCECLRSYLPTGKWNSPDFL